MDLLILIVFGGISIFLLVKNNSLQKVIKKYKTEEKLLKSLNDRIDTRQNELALILDRIKILKVQKQKEELSLEKIPNENSYVEMTIGEFREISNNLIQQIPESVEKEAIINFLRIDLTFIDSAKAKYDLIEIQKELHLNDLVAFINKDGCIEWSLKNEVTNPKLIIGKPRLRVEFYNSIINLMINFSNKKT